MRSRVINNIKHFAMRDSGDATRKGVSGNFVYIYKAGNPLEAEATRGLTESLSIHINDGEAIAKIHLCQP